MVWINNNAIPKDLTFLEIISSLVINCPSCERKKVLCGKTAEGKKKYKTEYKPISMRNSTFRSRGINKSMFTTILSQIKIPLENNGTYALLRKEESVEEKVNSIISNVHLGDPYYDLVVYQHKSEMTDLETFYYYIRNAFAHGAFEVINTKGGRVYKLESARNGNVKAWMRLKEKTLKKYIEFSLYEAINVESLRKKRGKKKL